MKSPSTDRSGKSAWTGWWPALAWLWAGVVAAEPPPDAVNRFLLSEAAGFVRVGEPECIRFDPALGLPLQLQCSAQYRARAGSRGTITVALNQRAAGFVADLCEHDCGDGMAGSAASGRAIVVDGTRVWLYFAPNGEGDGLASAAASTRYDVDMSAPGFRSDAPIEAFVRALPWAVLGHR
jgi:hypothetical protein